MQRGLITYMKLCVLSALLLETTLAIANANKESAVSQSEEEEVNLEWEVFGTSHDRHYGINILDKNGKVIISDPTDRVLRAVVHPESAPESLALHKVKAMYQRLLREEGVDEGNVQVHDNSQHELAEGAAGKEQNGERDGSVLSNLLGWFWG